MKPLLKIVFFAIAIVSYTSPVALSQPTHGHPPMDKMQAMERIHAAKIAYITDRLHLTEQQSGSFIPLYNQYEREIRETRQAFFKKYRNSCPGPGMGMQDDSSARQYIDDNLDYQQQVIDIKRKYNDRFLAIISATQLADLSKAEREFKQILMRRLNEHGGGGGGGRFNHNFSNGY